MGTTRRNRCQSIPLSSATRTHKASERNRGLPSINFFAFRGFVVNCSLPLMTVQRLQTMFLAVWMTSGEPDEQDRGVHFDRWPESGCF